jgi:predicted AAA+ superfamily ATPase
MVTRKSNEILDQLAQTFKIVAITGPRQSGKTTLAKAFFDEKP